MGDKVGDKQTHKYSNREDVAIREEINIVSSMIIVVAGSQTADAVATPCVADRIAAHQFAIFGSISTHNKSFLICILFENSNKTI